MILDQFKLDDKVAIVTGAAQGLGQGIALGHTRALREDPAQNKAILDRIPAGRWGTPQDLQGVAVFLASAASQYLQGNTIPVDGGWLARKLS